MVMLSHLLGTGREGPTRLVPGLRCGSSSFIDALGGTVEATVGTDCQRQNTNILKTLTKTKKTTGQHNPIRAVDLGPQTCHTVV